MRAAATSGILDASGLIKGIILAGAALLLSYWFLVRSYRYVLRRGLFTRFMTD